ncbi:hypothetical protein MA16_Dca027228 [Dendrobium catenatum]|uniref:Uncharacterized protein n=1 Tax=Dendrobium catenatum TaxID=906689 RepID=A0A2I0VGP7_9ASPA|nr:hypothetical protein MA16_Dca027228 [Dendrobium catenatum]
MPLTLDLLPKDQIGPLRLVGPSPKKVPLCRETPTNGLDSNNGSFPLSKAQQPSLHLINRPYLLIHPQITQPDFLPTSSCCCRLNASSEFDLHILTPCLFEIYPINLHKSLDAVIALTTEPDKNSSISALLSREILLHRLKHPIQPLYH